MKVEYINPFLKASVDVLRMMAQIEFAMGKPYLKTSPFTAENLIIVVGITGEIRGQAVISMSIDMATLRRAQELDGLGPGHIRQVPIKQDQIKILRRREAQSLRRLDPGCRTFLP